jgi:hypothetical protein
MFHFLICISVASLLVFVTSVKGNTAAQSKYNVRAFECDEQFRMLSTEERQRKIQGVPTRICLQPDEAALNDGITIETIEAWSWETTFEGGEARQQAVMKGRGDGMLSSTSCKDDGTLCVIDTMLTGRFYKNAGSVFGLGEVTLTSGAGTVPVQKDLFQTEFNFKFTHGPGGDQMSPEETQEVLKMMAEQQAGAHASKEKEKSEGQDKPTSDEL